MKQQTKTIITNKLNCIYKELDREITDISYVKEKLKEIEILL